MTKKFWLVALCCLPMAALAEEGAAASSVAAPAAPMVSGDVCLIQGVPPAEFKYVVLRKLVAKKGSYGSVAEMLPELASQAQAVGGTALINYNGGQHFGFFPWRLTRPIVSGTAIRWEGPTPNCTAAGGATVSAVIASNQEPKKLNAAATATAAEPAASQSAQP